jgi:hypothetical protein
MSDETDTPPSKPASKAAKPTPQQARAARLAQALRANIGKRKAAGRGESGGSSQAEIVPDEETPDTP